MPIRTLLCAALLVAGPASAQPLVSLFDAGAEGWGVETRTNPAASFSLVATYTPDFVPTGGDAGGHIVETDPDGNWSFFRAPSSWHGDRSAFSGRVLRYSTRTDAVTFPDGRLVIMFGNNGARLSHDAGVPPIDTWVRRVVPLRAGSWFVGTNGGGTPATQAQIDAVLADLEALYIGLEFGSDALEERVELDRIAFGVCDVDVAEPFGLLDLADVTGFISSFLAQQPPADLNADGLFDLDDLSAFITLFLAGC